MGHSDGLLDSGPSVHHVFGHLVFLGETDLNGWIPRGLSSSPVSVSPPVDVLHSQLESAGEMGITIDELNIM